MVRGRVNVSVRVSVSVRVYNILFRKSPFDKSHTIVRDNKELTRG